MKNKTNVKVAKALHASHISPKEEGCFWALVNINLNGCWLWKGVKHMSGYGSFRLKGKATYSHRIAYALTRGVVGDEVVRHKCDNPACVNPYHLEVGTHADNYRDQVARGRHTRGEKTWSSILSEDDVRFIRSSDIPIIELARKFRVHKTTIYRVRTTSWKHIKD